MPVQFLVQVVAPPSCSIAPDVYELSERSCIPVQVGQTFTSRLIAINSCGSGVTITDIATLSFSGMVQSSVIQQNSTTYYKTLSWTPTASQIGFQVMCAMAINRFVISNKWNLNVWINRWFLVKVHSHLNTVSHFM